MLIRDEQYQTLQRSVLKNHFDANDALFLERELTQLRAKMFEVAFPLPIARTLAPKATDIAPSAETYAYKVFEPVGAAKFINYKSNDIPRVDTVAREVLGRVRPIGAAYAWTINELREAARLGLQLSDMKAKTARDFIERGIDHVLAFGSIPDETGALPDVGLTGLVNNALVVALTVLSGGWWLNPTPLDPDVVLADLSKLASEVSNFSDGQWNANTILLPVRHYTYIEQTPFSTLSGDSILTVFKRNNPGISMIQPWYKLNTAGSGGAPRAIAYQRDSTVLESVIPQEFEALPPEVQAFEFVVNCHARCGGVKIYQPLGMRYMDFATS